MKIKKNDNVIVTAGKDKGKTGKVTQVFPAQKKVVVAGVNVRYRHLKPRRQNEKGQRLEYNAPLDAAKVMLVDPKTGQPTRVGYKILPSGEKVRVAKKSGEII